VTTNRSVLGLSHPIVVQVLCRGGLGAKSLYPFVQSIIVFNSFF
jgi:hypothetical protein